MARQGHSAGVLLHRGTGADCSVLLVLPGGPYWAKKDAGAWQIPKGMINPGESSEAAARREVEEELGVAITGSLRTLGQIRQAGGKLVDAFAVQQDLEADAIVSNRFELEWPPRSGKRQSFPEVAKARWMPLAEARAMILASQLPLLDRLKALLAAEHP